MYADHNSFTLAEQHMLKTAAVAVGVASFVGSAAIVLSWCRFRALRTFSFSLIMLLSVADMGSNVSYFLGNPEDGTAACTAQAFMQQFFEIASIFLTSSIAVTIYQTTLSKPTPSMLKLNTISWLLPFLMASLPLMTGSYGSVGAWCWIQTNQGTDSSPVDFYVGTSLRFALFYLPLWACIALNAATYIYVTRHVKRFSGMGSVGQQRAKTVKLIRLVHRLRFYPLILVVAWAPSTINRLHDAVDPGRPVFWLSLLAVLCRSAQGLMNALTYGFNRTVREAWRRDLCGKKFRSSEEDADSDKAKLIGDAQDVEAAPVPRLRQPSPKKAMPREMKSHDSDAGDRTSLLREFS